jgi:hypothetical protein
MLSKEFMDQAEFGTKVVGAIVALFTAVCFLVQYSRANREKAVDLSRKLLDTLFADPFSRSALRMLDWEERIYDVPGVGRELIHRDLVARGLQVTGDLNFSETEQYVRDCFERLYDQTEIFEHFIRRKLLDFDDLKPPLASYIGIIRKEFPIHQPFLTAYDYQLTLAFIERFPPVPMDAYPAIAC